VVCNSGSERLVMSIPNTFFIKRSLYSFMLRMYAHNDIYLIYYSITYSTTGQKRKAKRPDENVCNIERRWDIKMKSLN